VNFLCPQKESSFIAPSSVLHTFDLKHRRLPRRWAKRSWDQQT